MPRHLQVSTRPNTTMCPSSVSQQPPYQDVNISALPVVVSQMCLGFRRTTYVGRSISFVRSTVCLIHSKTLLCHYLVFRITQEISLFSLLTHSALYESTFTYQFLHYIRIKSLPNKSTQLTQDSSLPIQSFSILHDIILFSYITVQLFYIYQFDCYQL